MIEKLPPKFSLTDVADKIDTIIDSINETQDMLVALIQFINQERSCKD